MRIREKVKSEIGFKGYVRASGLIVPDKMDDINELKERAFFYYPYTKREYEKGNKKEVLRIIRQGLIPETQKGAIAGGENTIVRGFYNDFFARLMGSNTTPSVNQTLYIEYFAVGSDYSDTGFTDTTLGNEIYRAVPDEYYEDTLKTFYATTYMKKSQANPDETTVSSSTTTVITVNDPTGFAIGGRIQVETGSNTYTCTILGVSGSDITVGAITGGILSNAGAFDSGDIPQSGDAVYVLHCEAGVFIGGTATASADTGVMMNRKLLEFNKKDTVSVLYDFILACTSVE